MEVGVACIHGISGATRLQSASNGSRSLGN